MEGLQGGGMRRSITGIFVAAIACASSLASVGPARASTTTGHSLFLRLGVAAESGSTTYDRALFPHWIDADGDGCDTREEVLVYESRTSVYPGSGCRVTSGRWYSWYDGATWTLASDVDVDHVVALKEAWESGARRWTTSDRRRFANDLGLSWSLDAVTDNVNQSKSDRDPAQWLPPSSSVRCTYAIHWVGVKYRWRLTIDSRERSALASILSGSCGARTITVPSRAI
jgi:uncharacterized protein DUF1524